MDGDNFELERSTDPDFLVNVKTIVNYPYDPDKTNYEIEDDLRDMKGGQRVYYRLRRTKSAVEWKWEEARRAEVWIDMNTTFAADTVILDDSDGSPKAVITWEPFRGVWVSGTEFLLKKSNLTSGSARESIKLTEDQARAGQYIDENIRYCNEFAYSVTVGLGNDFDSPPETKIPGTVLAVEIGTVRNLEASKGYFPDRTELKWTVEGVFDNYLIKRRVYGSGAAFAQIATVQGATAGDVQTDDSKGVPGVYYEYMVVGAVNCNSMTAVVKLPHSMQSDSGPGDQLAAFIGEDCRGIGVPVEIRNELTFYVMIRGAASESGHVHFIYYSARNGHLYRSDNGAEFAVDGLYGTADQPVVLDLRPWKE